MGTEFTSISGNHTGDVILPTASSTPTATPLIDTSEERVLLRDEITRAFNESLESGMEKENKKRELEHIKEQQMQLMLHRKARVKEEVSYADPRVMVTKRHITFNCDKSRAFEEGATMVKVYDWIGSLSPVPEYFEIVEYKRLLVPPDMEAQSGIYNMRESFQPVNMTRSEIVAFQGSVPPVKMTLKNSLALG